MSQPKTLLSIRLDSSTPFESPHPFPPSPSTTSNYKQTIRRYGSQHIRGMQSPSLKRETSIDGPNLTSPVNYTTRKNKKSLDFFSAALDDFRNAKRPSMSSTRNGGFSTRAGTMNSLSRTLKSTQTPQSVTSLANENLCFNLAATAEKDSKYPVKSLNDVEVRTNFKVNTLLSLPESGYVNSRNDFGQASMNLTPGLETLEFTTEGTLTQRSYRESVILQKSVSSKNGLNQVSSARQKTALSFKKERTAKSSKIIERDCKTKMKKAQILQSKETINEVTSIDREAKGEVERLCMEKRKKRGLERVMSRDSKLELKVNKEREIHIDNERMSRNLRTSHVISENPSIQKSQTQEQKVMEIQTPRADTIDNIEERTQELSGMKASSLGRRGILARKLEVEKNNGTKSVRCEEDYDYKPIQIKKESQTLEGQAQIGHLKRPSLRRMKSEVQRPLNMFEVENLEPKMEEEKEFKKDNEKSDKQHLDSQEKTPDAAADQEENQDVRKIDTNRRKRLEEWMKLRRKEDGGLDVIQDLCEEGTTEKEANSKFELFKQGGRTFFELNLENKFVQKYDFLRTRDDNLIMNTEENYGERIYTENPGAGNSTLESIRNIKNTTQKSLMTEGLSRVSKSEKQVKTDPSTMMVRYFDELNPLVIQPKFMESTGSMCVTELWGNKSKQDFYKVMRKPFQANTIFSLNPQPGIYRPEKPANTGEKYKRWLNGQDSKENETKISESLGVSETPSYFKSSRKGRHTRAFVLQGTPDARPKAGFHSRGLSSKDFL